MHPLDAITPTERASEVRHYLWTLELLGEALASNDDQPQMSTRIVSGLHDAIRIIARHGAQACGALEEQLE